MTPAPTDGIQHECRFAIHIPKKSSDRKDIHLVKEVLHHPDGRLEPHVRFIANFKRSFYVTQQAYRNHEQKKECEDLDKLVKYTCTESDLDRAVARALDKGWSNARLQQLAESPYLYGSDISSTSLIKHAITQKYPDAISPYRIAFLDFETDVVNGTEDPIIGTYICDGEAWAVIDKAFIAGYADVEGRLEACQALVEDTINKTIDDAIKEKALKESDREKFKLTYRFKVVDGPVAIIKTIIQRVHEQSPDFLAIWNMDFDVPKMLDTLKKYGEDPKDVFSDPKLPAEYRFCAYKKGSTKKITASGQVKPKNPSEQWHSLYCPAGFYIIDAMCSYRFIRQGAQEEPNYGLDAILKKEKVGQKLRHEATDHLRFLDYHYAMQTKHHFDYIAYALMDVIGMLALETKTNDLAQSLPIQSRMTDFARYNSQTKRFADRYHFFLLGKGKVVGTIPPRKKDDAEVDTDDIGDDDEEDGDDDDDDENDEDNGDPKQKREGTLSLRDWICTLSAHLSVLGARIIKECKTWRTLFRRMVYDSDAVSAYPSATMVGNVSRETTACELIDILGVDEVVFRKQNINLLQGHVNALEYGMKMHGLPTPQEALKYFDDL